MIACICEDKTKSVENTLGKIGPVVLGLWKYEFGLRILVCTV